MEIQWEEPSETRPGPPSKYQPMLNALRERPGQWAVIARDLHASNVTNLKRRYPDFEFTTRGGGPDGRCEKIFARFAVGINADASHPESHRETRS